MQGKVERAKRFSLKKMQGPYSSGRETMGRAMEIREASTASNRGEKKRKVKEQERRSRDVWRTIGPQRR